jgi:hypothetical protein
LANPATANAPTSSHGLAWTRSSQSGRAIPISPDTREQDAVDGADHPEGDHAADDRPEAEAGEAQPDVCRLVAEAVEHEHGQCGEEREPHHVAEDEHRGPRPEERIAPEKAVDRTEGVLVVLVPVGRNARRVHEQRDDDEAGDERRCVDEEHRRRAEHADEDTRDRRAEHRGEAIGRLEQRVRLAEPLLVVREEVGQQRGLRCERRRREDADACDEHEQQREAEQAGDVEQRDRRHERRP